MKLFNQWCHWQQENDSKIFCTSPIAEGRNFTCPYECIQDRENTEYPCSDYLPYHKKGDT